MAILTGNEYWTGAWSTSSDPAAACSSGITELHNSRVNPRVDAKYLRIASPQHGMLTVLEYLENIGHTSSIVDSNDKEEGVQTLSGNE